MPSINRSTYMTPVQRFTQPGGYDMGPGGQVIEFDPGYKGLQRRIGHRPLYTDLLRQGCQPTGRREGPPGFESEVYDCPGPMPGSPSWFQGRKPKRETVFGGLGAVVLVPGAMAPAPLPTRPVSMTSLGSFQGLVVPIAVVIAVGAVAFYGLDFITTARQRREIEQLRGRTF